MLAANGVIPVLLPGTSFNLGLNRHARAREMIDRFNLPVSLSTDYNPGSCPTESMQLVIMLASLNLKMTPEEILTACTINAACAIGRGDRIGSIEAGKRADLALFDASNLAYLPYRFGINHTFGVIKDGNVDRVEPANYETACQRGGDDAMSREIPYLKTPDRLRSETVWRRRSRIGFADGTAQEPLLAGIVGIPFSKPSISVSALRPRRRRYAPRSSRSRHTPWNMASICRT